MSHREIQVVDLFNTELTENAIDSLGEYGYWDGIIEDERLHPEELDWIRENYTVEVNLVPLDDSVDLDVYLSDFVPSDDESDYL